MNPPDWEGLAREIKARREELRLPQDLSAYGGPTALTVRKFERAEATTIRNKTKNQLERALQWFNGYVDLVLAGEDRAELNPRLTVETPDGTFITGVHDIKLTANGGEFRPRFRVENDSEEDPAGLAIEAFESATGPDRLVAAASIEVNKGSLIVQGVHRVIKEAPWHVVTGALVSRLMSTGSTHQLTRTEHDLLRAAIAAYTEARDNGQRGAS